MHQEYKVWQPQRFTPHPSVKPHGFIPYVTIILNNPLGNRQLLLDICEDALFTICADGGANRLKDLQRGNIEKIVFPIAICGDLDSIRPDVEEYYRSLSIKIVKDPDQYSTDLTKSLRYASGKIGEVVEENEDPRRLFDVAIFGSLGGRADQAFSQLHHLYTHAQDVLPMIGDLYLITAESVIILLAKGKNRIHTPARAGLFTENVGIIPIGRPSIITTHGLEWDVQDWHTEFGGQMSTSNHIRADIVDVETSERVLFTLELTRKVAD
ncbi:MAG: hypothetical protein ALECFALPRED_001606 [Alectoria fallacina]|uniref:Thiamine pyrophosphokinase n=1 Tax=Alectoria fallacina TaxID=1903189 RepID=A0A8H3FBT2_9LECA|nr:MAG: hypothetical protein ALECFALPRED_001606 [Alectoria fallacina]